MYRIAISSIVLFLLVQAQSLTAAPFAAVDVVNRGPLPLIEGDSPTTWRYLPDLIRGSTIYSDPLVFFPPDSSTTGVADFTVTQSGTIYIAAHYDYEGNSGGDWQPERQTREELLADGWSYDGDMRYGNGALFRLFERTVTAGDVYHLRVNKYTPPYIIVPTSQTGITPSNAAPWPVYGPVAVADFTPTTLGSSVVFDNLGPEEDVTFNSVPNILQGLTIFSDARRLPGRILDFTVVQDTSALLVAYWGYDGNGDGDWDDYRQTLPELKSQGWKHITQMTDAQGRVWDVIQKNLHTGETYSIRTNKYTMPRLLIGVVPEPSTWLLALVGAAALVGIRRRCR